MSTAPAPARLLAFLTRLITGVRARWVGAAPSGVQRVYYANHSSHLDTLVIWASLPRPSVPTPARWRRRTIGTDPGCAAGWPARS